MPSRLRLLFLFACFFFAINVVEAATTSSPVKSTTSSKSSTASSKSSTASSTASSATGSGTGSGVTTGTTTDAATSTVPDVYLNVPTLSVGRIELDVENLAANINLNAAVAGLVSLNAGVAVSIQTVNLTITDVDAQLELMVRLGNLVDIVNRVFQSLDLNPLLISALNDTTSIVDAVVGAVDGLLGSITQGGTTLSFLIDNLGNIVQEVGGVSTIVGNYLTNMTDTGASTTLSGGLVEKVYSYTPLNALVDIIFNSAGQIVQATVEKASTTGQSTTAPATTAPVTTASTTSTSVATSSSPTSTS